MKLALAQIAPVWLNKEKTLEKVVDYIHRAGKEKAKMVVFGEGLLPGYPFWLAHFKGAEFEAEHNKKLHAHYLKNAVCIENGELDPVCKAAKASGTAVYLGIIERPQDRGGHSVYCSLVYIDASGTIQSVHRKLQPTYEERLTWSPGHGHGLKTHPLEEFTVGGLNCWENWMPMPRAALYAQGENLHVAVWPGNLSNTNDITRFIAKESRSFVVSVSGLLCKKDIPKETPYYEELLKVLPDHPANGGSCVAGPDGEWVLEPVIDKEGLFTTEVSIERVFEERQNFDQSGHYSRPDVLQLHLNSERQSVLKKL
ncbi:carbon-nitrogen hydrolase family protein [Robertkochia marina]|uniref:Carbon-nitrogen hydrolase family protein n=1 Tax=Robertkochia marina TaxID=1227945 RepID=A0A4S3M2A8_9FLAO|nr:carbon-nitrogen hydrolase family protein [Robertkochia marina]THD69254.1 carbon-nitrogen hydrolase family protein [Robertkochia marina]TRZ47488.1 carbon-nitrogen hydrolase family protein [Robertkochia marina]